VKSVLAHAGHVCWEALVGGSRYRPLTGFLLRYNPHLTMQNFILLTIHTTYPLSPPVEIYSIDAARYDARGKYITCIDAFEGLTPDDLEEIGTFFGDPTQTFLVAENPDVAQKLLTAAFRQANLPTPAHHILDPYHFGVPLEWFPRFFVENSEQVMKAFER